MGYGCWQRKRINECVKQLFAHKKAKKGFPSGNKKRKQQQKQKQESQGDKLLKWHKMLKAKQTVGH